MSQAAKTDPWSLPVALPVTEEEWRQSQPVPPAPPRRNFVVRWVLAVGSAVEWLFGFACLFVALAVLAALPVLQFLGLGYIPALSHKAAFLLKLPLLQFLSLGYLLEAGGRVARTGKLREGFIGVRLAARLGGVVLGSCLLLLPIRFVADMARAAEIIDPAAAWPPTGAPSCSC